MRFALLIYTNEADRPAWGTPEGDREAEAYNAFHAELTERGALRGGDPLLRVEEAKTVEIREGKTNVAPGPAVAAPRQLGGYYVIECKDIDEATEWAAKIPGAQYGAIEVRPVLELS